MAGRRSVHRHFGENTRGDAADVIERWDNGQNDGWVDGKKVFDITDYGIPSGSTKVMVAVDAYTQIVESDIYWRAGSHAGEINTHDNSFVIGREHGYSENSYTSSMGMVILPVEDNKFTIDATYAATETTVHYMHLSFYGYVEGSVTAAASQTVMIRKKAITPAYDPAIGGSGIVVTTDTTHGSNHPSWWVPDTDENEPIEIQVVGSARFPEIPEDATHIIAEVQSYIPGGLGHKLEYWPGKVTTAEWEADIGNDYTIALIDDNSQSGGDIVRSFAQCLMKIGDDGYISFRPKENTNEWSTEITTSSEYGIDYFVHVIGYMRPARVAAGNTTVISGHNESVKLCDNANGFPTSSSLDQRTAAVLLVSVGQNGPTPMGFWWLGGVGSGDWKELNDSGTGHASAGSDWDNSMVDLSITLSAQAIEAGGTAFTHTNQHIGCHLLVTPTRIVANGNDSLNLDQTSPWGQWRPTGVGWFPSTDNWFDITTTAPVQAGSWKIGKIDASGRSSFYVPTGHYVYMALFMDMANIGNEPNDPTWPHGNLWSKLDEPRTKCNSLFVDRNKGIEDISPNG